MRTLQRDLQHKGVDSTAITFIRRDVYDLLVDYTPDRGKEAHVDLDWSDDKLLQELLLLRIRSSVPEMLGSFEDVWMRLFEAHVGGESSFRYLLRRTFLRPRDVLNLVRKCAQVAVSRRHDRISEEDILDAEREYSEDMYNDLRYELRDIYPQYADVLPMFIDAPDFLSHDDIAVLAMEAGVPEERCADLIQALLWFSFLGVHTKDDEVFAYDLGYSLDRLRASAGKPGNSNPLYTVHPGFRMALRIVQR